MLLSLHIQNIALIEECRIELEKGLNILSGETGAGKSIIIDALSFVLGSRADKTLIRHGSNQAVVVAVFSIGAENYPLLAELGLEEEDTLIIKRTMSDTKNEVRVNGQLFTLSMLRRLTSSLVDIHGQHEHQSLLRAATHLELLDRYDPTIAPLLSQYVLHYHAYRAVCKELESFGDERERARKAETLAFQIEDIRKVNPVEGEEEELLKERERMRNAERIVAGVAEGYGALDSDEGLGALACLSMALSGLRSVLQFDDQLEEWYERLDSARIEIDDVAACLKDYVESFDFDQRAFDRVERRVDAIRRLKRKYGATVEEVLAALEEYEKELEILENSAEKIEKLQNQRRDLSKCLYSSGIKLSRARRAAAKRFERAIVTELADLSMSGTTFEVEFSPIPGLDDSREGDFATDSEGKSALSCGKTAPSSARAKSARGSAEDEISRAKPSDIEEALLEMTEKGFDIEEALLEMTEKGFDKVEFLISPNKGEPLRPLAKIASGGEMSRLMLALKNILADLDSIDTLVFDEIDTGISGFVAHAVAQKLCHISAQKQVIAITHLPQLASFADHHYLISKSTVGNKTRTDLLLLEGDTRLAEVARLSGSVTDMGKQHAAELIASAQEYKGKLN